MKHIMIDIETMGTNTSKSLVLSVGAIAFDLAKEGPNLSGNIFMRVLFWEQQIINGRLIEPGTQKWWSEQTQGARDHWENPPHKIQPAFLSKEFIEYRDLCLGDPGTLIWANGIVFDIGNLESLFLQHSSDIPWKYNLVRDARTIYNLPKLRSMPETFSFVGHDPVEDCRKQIWRLWEHMPEEMLV